MLMEPTSLNRGEGPMTGLSGDVGGGVGASKGGGEVDKRWWWMNKSEVQWLIELMWNSNSDFQHR